MITEGTSTKVSGLPGTVEIAGAPPYLFEWSESAHWLPLAITGLALIAWIVSLRFKRAWAALFGFTLALMALWTLQSARSGLWLPESASLIADEVDGLFHLVMALTSIFYLLTQGVLIWTLLQPAPPGGRAARVHGNHLLELVWFTVPTGLLVYIALVQLPTWAKMKGQVPGAYLAAGYQPASDPADLLLTVTGRQWEWRMRYHSPDQPMPVNPLFWAATPAAEDIHAVNELHAWQGAKVRMMLRTTDVIHSFFLPQFRFKQDMLPGKTIPALLHTDRSNIEADGTERVWEIACAELCGGNHYRMRGKVVIHRDKKEFMDWLNRQTASQSERKESAAALPTPKPEARENQ